MPIHTSPNHWVLETRHTAYAFGLSAAGLLAHHYWGARLPRLEDYPIPAEPQGYASTDGPHHFIPEEYPADAGVKYIDPCLKVVFADGVRDAVLRYVDFSVRDDSAPELAIRLQDVYYPLSVTLHYRIHPDYDLIERWVTLENLGSDPIHIQRAFSAKWTLPPGDDYFFTHMVGRHADEFNLVREPLTPGLKTIESRRIIPSHRAAHGLPLTATQTKTRATYGLARWPGAATFASAPKSPNLPPRASAWGLTTGTLAGGCNRASRWSPCLRCAATPGMGSARPAASFTTMSATNSYRMARPRTKFSTTRGKPPCSTWTKPRSLPWQTLPRAWAWNCSSWMMAGFQPQLG